MPGRFRYVSLLTLTLLALIPCRLSAQESVQVQPEVANSRYQFAGAVSSGDVYVRSGPGDAYYATMRLPAGSQVTVVGIKYDWLKIVPPPDSFCYVSKLFIERSGDGSIGRVTHPDVNVRAGSTQSALKTTVLGRLASGDEVKILGEEDEYYKIAPPQGVYLYVNKQFVNPVRSLGTTPAETPSLAATGSDSTASSGNGTDSTTQPSSVVTTNTPDAETTVAPTPAPATQPAVAAAPQPSAAEVAESKYLALESEFAAASQKLIEEQPVADLEARYDVLAKNNDLPLTERENAGFRVAVLNVRLEAQRRLADVAAMQADAAKRSVALKAEQDELQKRLDAHDVTVYTAVGQLQASSLQYGAQTLYRLADPATGHTVIYVRGDNGAALKLVGQFVGVRGDTATDGRLDIQVIAFTSIEPVDPAQVNGKVISTIIPPSMLGHAVQASAGN